MIKLKHKRLNRTMKKKALTSHRIKLLILNYKNRQTKTKTKNKYIFPTTFFSTQKRKPKRSLLYRKVTAKKNHNKTQIYNSYVSGSGIGASNIVLRRLKQKLT